uniref:MFS domain-containing protein n=1 Tax=Panagrellus redivivus TaxID=6233 RepID=A0A7E4ZWQ7_PANRE
MAEAGIYCCHLTRFIVLALTTACMTMVISNSLAMNFTVICMWKDGPAGIRLNSTNGVNSLDLNSTLSSAVREPMFSKSQQSTLFSAIAIGNILGTLPLTFLLNNWGIRYTFTLYGLISAFSTLFVPVLVDVNFWLIVFMRILQGFALAVSFPSLGAVVSSWGPMKSSGTYICLISCHFQLGALVAMLIPGELCTSSYGWPAVYYGFGIATLALFAPFFIYFRDSPHIHRNVSSKELNTISLGKPTSTEKQPVPYSKIIKDLAFIGICVSNIGGGLGVQLMFQYGPIYLNKVLGFDPKATGMAAAVPYAICIVVKVIIGPLSDMMTCGSERTKIIIFNTISQLPMAICFVTMALAGNDMVWLIQIAYSLVNACAGLSAVGVTKSIQLIARQHSHFIMTVMSFIVSVIILILPYAVMFIAPDNTRSQWAIIFLGSAGLITFTTMFFNFTAQAETRPWAEHSDKRTVSIRMRRHQSQTSSQPNEKHKIYP